MRQQPDTRPIALLDANVLFSQVLSDYFVKAQSEELLTVTWSSQILDEMIRNKKVKAAKRFREPADLHARLAAAEKLNTYIRHQYPSAFVEPDERHFVLLAEAPMPDPDDRHVVAAAIAARATHLCTDNTVHFPHSVLHRLGIEVVTPDELLVRLAADHPVEMTHAHQRVIEWTPGTTHRRTLATLRRAQSPMVAAEMEQLLSTLGNLDSRDDLAQRYDDLIMERRRALGGLPSPRTIGARARPTIAREVTLGPEVRRTVRQNAIGGR